MSDQPPGQFGGPLGYWNPVARQDDTPYFVANLGNWCAPLDAESEVLLPEPLVKMLFSLDEDAAARTPAEVLSEFLGTP